jgi:3-methylcrotonyl-CoA carboxylase beta subunit
VCHLHARGACVPVNGHYLDAHALGLARRIVADLPPLPSEPTDQAQPEDPYYDPAELYGIVSADPKTGIGSL